MSSSTRICFITAIYGNYETSCKKFVKQTVETDFICFTDNTDIIRNGWTIDTTPYHLSENTDYINSIRNNKHTFNIAKYYKQSFRHIPRLQQYDIVVWLDGTIEIIYDKTSEYICDHIYQEKIIGWHHEFRNGILKNEVRESKIDRYMNTSWGGQEQPYQDVEQQYRAYIADGYDEFFFKRITTHTSHLGVWITCFVAFLQKDDEVKDFLDLWYLQTLQYTTQDQIGFSYVCQKTGRIPYTLPNAEVYGDYPHSNTMFYIKQNHGI